MSHSIAATQYCAALRYWALQHKRIGKDWPFFSWICAGVVATQRGIAGEVEVWILIYVYGSRFGHGALESHIFISPMIVFIPLGIVMMPCI